MSSSYVEEFLLRHRSLIGDSIAYSPVVSWEFLCRLEKSAEDLYACASNVAISTEDIWKYFQELEVKVTDTGIPPENSNWPQIKKIFLNFMTGRTDLPTDFYELCGNDLQSIDYSTMDLTFLISKEPHPRYGGVIFMLMNPRVTVEFLKISAQFAEEYAERGTRGSFILKLLNDNIFLPFAEKQRILEYLNIWNTPRILSLRDLSLTTAEELFIAYRTTVPARKLFCYLHVAKRGQYFLDKYPDFHADLISGPGALTHRFLVRKRLYKTPWSLLQHVLGDLDETDIEMTTFLLKNKFVPLQIFLDRTFPRDGTGEVHNGFIVCDLLQYCPGLTPTIIDKLLAMEMEEWREDCLCSLMRNKYLSWTILERYYIKVRDFNSSIISECIKNYVTRSLSRNPNLPLCFFERYPELINSSILENKFTYQLRLENNALESTLAWNVSQMLDTYARDSLVCIVLNIINEETQKLEREGKLQEIFP